MKLKPLGDRVIVQAIEEEETTASGIVLPDTAKEKPEGDEVLYSKYGGTEINVDGEDLLVLRESDVLAKVA